MMTLARDKSGSFWQRDGKGPLIEIEVSYERDRFGGRWHMSYCWQNDVPLTLPDDDRDQIESWFDANVLYDYSN